MSSMLPHDYLPPDVPVRDGRGNLYCNRRCAESRGIRSRDMSIITFRERHYSLDNGAQIPQFMGFCAACRAII